ncbi:MAG: 7-cyano-7-deazaguanine synthase QueC [Planctomycetaceae bacterium]|jgi:7-cyano-7-deazaguanine synthase|nr:7-cyano-7-deazaguanine synthase QueC [Planctomycetaceae bacterium]
MSQTVSQSPAVVLLSGGLDSTTSAAVAKTRCSRIIALTIDYSQRNSIEIEAARRVAKFFQVERHIVFPLNLRLFGGSALTDDIDVPKDTPLTTIGGTIPVTYVPARNTIFLSLALGLAESVHADSVFIGANALDSSGYPDCRPEYIEAFQKMATLATKTGVEGKPIKIETPLITLTKKEIIKLGTSLGVDYSITHTCYDPAKDGKACGHCESCVLRKNGFREAGVDDPTRYVENF